MGGHPPLPISARSRPDCSADGSERFRWVDIDLAAVRDDDGVDNDLAHDWHVDRSPSPGETNASSVVVDTDTAETRGCGKNDPGGPSGGGCGQRSAPDGDVGGCSTGGERAMGAAALLAIGLIRRKKR